MPDFDHMGDGWNGHMMGGSSAWTPGLLILLFVLTLLLILAAVLAFRLFSPGGSIGQRSSGHVGQPAEPPDQMLDRLFAAGEIDETTYRARRTALAEMRPTHS